MQTIDRGLCQILESIVAPYRHLAYNSLADYFTFSLERLPQYCFEKFSLLHLSAGYRIPLTGDDCDIDLACIFVDR